MQEKINIMKFSPLFTALLATSANAFITPKLPLNNNVGLQRTSLQMSFVTPPSSSLEQLSSLLLSDEAVSEAVSAVVSDPAVQDAAATNNGWFGFLTGPIEFLLQLIHQGFGAVGLEANSWGLSIIAMTVLVKLVTYPLTKQQLESTTKMQSLQPVIKGIQSTYASNPEVMNQKVAEVYQNEGVNPLAGCIPAIIQLPVFIGLYRAVLSLAKENYLDQPFLWLPSLEGPTYGADPAKGSEWILKGWEGGVPTLGWEDTIAYLSIPIFLVISQSISQQLMQPKNQDPSAAEANAVLKFLPLLIGWFSLNVPSALGIYWVANNIFTTALTLQIRSSIETSGTGDGAAVMDAKVITEPPKPTFTPPEMTPKPAGFGSGSADGMDDDGVKQITTPIDAEIVQVEENEVEAATTFSKSQQKKRGKGKKKRGKK